MMPGGEKMAKEFVPPTQRERNKYRAAEAAGLLERVLEAGLSAKESGRIGGISAHMDKDRNQE